MTGGFCCIIFVNRNGLRWRNAPREYAPAKTLYNRWKQLRRIPGARTKSAPNWMGRLRHLLVNVAYINDELRERKTERVTGPVETSKSALHTPTGLKIPSNGLNSFS
jgi:transposase